MDLLVGASTGVMKPLLYKLSKLLEEEYVKVKGVRKEIKFLRDELSAMSATLEVLADAEQLDKETRDWRDRLRELAYDLEDCIDAFMARVDNGHDGRSGFIMGFFHKLKQLKPHHKIANQIKELKIRTIQVSERHKRYNMAQLPHKSGPSSIDPRVLALHEDIENLVGIECPKKRVIDLLTMDQMNGSSVKQLKVVSIVGCGGLGKTTLAKQVYDTIKSQFSCAAFVSVSRTPDVRKILAHIANDVKFAGNTLDYNEQQLIDKLKEYLHDKRYIVVIDDIWKKEAWEFIKVALPNNDLRSRIITSTRSVTIGNFCSSQAYKKILANGGFDHPHSSSQVYEMQPLSFDDSKRLFFRRAFGSENSCFPHLEDVPDRILKKCNGLPLAIVTLSSMLTNELAREEWDRVLSAIGLSLANKNDAKNMTIILSLSYFDIPCHLRTCLLYLSAFPEDYAIEKKSLINRWIAEGFIHEEEGRTKYETGEGYFNDLINRSMIQPVGIKYGEAMTYRVHDIILDYIKCKAAEENFVTSLGAAGHECSSGHKVRRLCVSNYREENLDLWASQIMSQVRSITIFGQPVKTSLLPSNLLRVLDLDNVWGMENHHLEGVEKMLLLKYLRISDLSITKLPKEIGELQYLQTLDVRGTRIKELPSTITKLQRLSHLYVNDDMEFPDGMIANMPSLEELSQYGFRSYEQMKALQEFSKLTKLRTLKVRQNFKFSDGLEVLNQAQDVNSYYVGTLFSLRNIRNLYIKELRWPLLLDSWKPAAPCSLRKLCMTKCPFYKVPYWMGSLGNLRVLALQIICLGPDDVEILGAIPSLLFLDLIIVGGNYGRITIHRSNKFRS